ncbi:MAG: steroid-24-oyl-CoA synthetase, partial [Acidimicrobiaceae bacterium]
MPTYAEVKAQLTGPGGPFEVVTEEVRGRAMQVYKDRMMALRQICEIGAARGDQTFIVYGDREIAFGEFVSLANSVSPGLQKYGVGHG